MAPTTGAKWMAAAVSGVPNSPQGRRPATLSVDTKTSSKVRSWLAVPRMPRGSQVSSSRTPGAATGTAKCSTSAPGPGSPITAVVATTVASGDWLQNALRPLTRKPSVLLLRAGTATAVGHSQSDPPLVAMSAARDTDPRSEVPVIRA